MAEPIAFTLNDKPVRLDVDGERTLLWVLRTDLGLTGTKFGCGEGHCGSCAVMVNGTAVRSCLWKVKNVANKEVVTVEGLAKGGTLHPRPNGCRKPTRPPRQAAERSLCKPNLSGIRKRSK